MKLNLSKKTLASIATLLLAIGLFGVVFIALGWSEPNAEFFIELGLVSAISIFVKVMWSSIAYEDALKTESITKLTNAYYTQVDDVVGDDTTTLSVFIAYFNNKNTERYIIEKIGSRTEENCKNYKKIVLRIKRKADRLPKVRLEELVVRTKNQPIINSKDYTKSGIASTTAVGSLISIICATALAYVALDSILLSWENVFKYIMYLGTIFSAYITSLFSTTRLTLSNTSDHLARCSLILTEYKSWKKENMNKETPHG